MMTGMVGFLTYEQMHGFMGQGESIARAHKVIQHWPEAECFKIGRRYTAVIFQNSFWLEYAKRFSGVKILDLSNPAFLWNPSQLVMASLCDAITTPTPALSEYVARHTSVPTFCVPNGLDLAELPPYRKDHSGNGAIQKAAWFGDSRKYSLLDAALPSLAKCGINTLIVISKNGASYCLPSCFGDTMRVSNYTWDRDTAPLQLLEADVVVNFPADYEQYRLMHDEKAIFAWSLGLPVARSTEELAAFMTEEARIVEINRRLVEIELQNDIRATISQYKRLISSQIQCCAR